MREASLLELARGTQPSRYGVTLMRDPDVRAGGVLYHDERGSQSLEWSAVQAALAGEVGEPEGVSTVVFDLIVGSSDGPQGRCYSVLRLDADPGVAALTVATTIARSIGAAACASIKSLAAEGVPSIRYPDLDEFEAAALEALSAG